jgi:hypothetical protein
LLLVAVASYAIIERPFLLIGRSLGMSKVAAQGAGAASR